MKQVDIIKKYGEPDPNGNYLVTIDLPYPMRLAWDTKKTVNKIRCHKLVADKFKIIFQQILDSYGFESIKDLGIDLFGGCFNYRQKRLGQSLSLHSWGIAIDLDPARNGLKTPKSKSQFSKPEYKKMIEIFKNNGFDWGGDLWNKDCMHFQVSN